MGKVARAARKHGSKVTIIALLGAAYPYFTTVVEAHHKQEMAKINKDSARISEYEIWNNNEHDCYKEKIDSVFHFNCN